MKTLETRFALPLCNSTPRPPPPSLPPISPLLSSQYSQTRLSVLFRIGDDFSFDEKMAQFGCNVSAFDPSMGKEDHMHSPRVMFYNLALSNMNQERNESVLDPLNKSAWKSRTLARIMRELGHSQVIRSLRFIIF